MAILLGIAVSDVEYYINKEATLKTAENLKGLDIDVMLVYDEYTNFPFVDEFRKNLKNNLYVVKIKGFGLGKARNTLAVEAWKRKYDCVLISDSHMRYYDPERSFKKLCSEYAAVPVQIDQTERASDVGIYISFYSFAWGHYARADYIPMTSNPFAAFSYKAIDDLIAAQGMFTPTYYWGYELFDPTVSLARLGHWIKVINDVKVGHWYRRNGELGAFYDVRNNVPITHEPFKFVALLRGDPPYYAGIKYSAATYAAKHYKLLGFPINGFDFRRLPAVDPAYLSVQTPEILGAITRFNKNAKYSILDVYKEFQRRLDSGRILAEHKNVFF